MIHIPSFHIFEGLLKPRDISGRKEQHAKNLALRYPGLQPFTRHDIETIKNDTKTIIPRHSYIDYIDDDWYKVILLLSYKKIIHTNINIVFYFGLQKTTDNIYTLSTDIQTNPVTKDDRAILLQPTTITLEPISNLSYDKLLTTMSDQANRAIKNYKPYEP